MALFVCNDLKCKLIERMSIVIDDLMECISVELEIKKQKNIVVTCVDRTQGSCVKTFIDSLEQLLSVMNDNKTCYLWRF